MTQDSMRYCDLVMKGGVASGVVYPEAVLALASQFHFKSIGGTSAGAIAAAATAAASLGERRIKLDPPQQAGAAPPVSAQGMKGLREVCEKLAGERFILNLFQPAWGGESAFRLIVLLTSRSASPARKIAAALAAPLRIAPLGAVLTLGLLLALGFWGGGAGGMLATLAPSLLCAYLCAAVFAVLKIAHVVRKNLFGLCSGLGVETQPAWFQSLSPSRFKRPSKPALTEWMHEVLQTLSGKPSSDPLRFEDLWDASRYPEEPKAKRAIDLQMITTNVSHHEPLTLPFSDKANFWFRREEFARLFPADLVQWMVEEARRTGEVRVKVKVRIAGKETTLLLGESEIVVENEGRIERVVLQEGDVMTRRPGAVVILRKDEILREIKGEIPYESFRETYWRAPTGGRMPVLVAMRMSLSFPLLISAVPLHEPTPAQPSVPGSRKIQEAKAEKIREAEAEASMPQAPAELPKSVGERMEALTTGGEAPIARSGNFRSCWFSDGGASSNFPIHLFDSPLPVWPTFAIDLVYTEKEESDAGEETIRRAVHLPAPSDGGGPPAYRQIEGGGDLAQLGRFLFGLVRTMQNWRDLLRSRSPGHRERIVRVSLGAGEGGMSLDMASGHLNRIRLKGEEAGRRLTGFAFEDHRWIRWRALSAALQDYAQRLAPPEAGDSSAPQRSAFQMLRSASTPPFAHHPFASDAERLAAETMLEEMIDWGARLKAQDLNLRTDAPQPESTIQVAPIF